MRRRLTQCVADLGKHAHLEGVDISDELEAIGKKIREGSMPQDAWGLVCRARDRERPRAREVIDAVFDGFDELHGDRCLGDDGAVLGGIAFLGERPVTVIANDKGTNLKDTVARNAGMASPEGYRKALRLARQAEKFSRPIVTFVDTAGAFPGLAAEERGIGSAIAMNLREFSHLETPIVCVVLGEGGSGGALGLCVGDRVIMLENSYFSVTTPELFASLVLRDDSLRERAAAMMRITPPELMQCGFCDGILPETKEGYAIARDALFGAIRARVEDELSALDAFGLAELVARRNGRYAGF